MEHKWPTDQEDHIWTVWMLWSPREGPNPPVQYRACIHPDCKVVEKREVLK